MPWRQHLEGRDRWISMSLRLAWSTVLAIEQLGLLHREILSQTNKQTKKKQNMLVVVSPPMSTTSLYWCRVGFQSEMTSLLFRRP